jgi:hypothetical protein
MKHKLLIGLDFDGTVTSHAYPNIGIKAPQALVYLREWSKSAYIILFTMRSGKELDEAVEYLRKEGVNLYGVNTNPTQQQWTKSPKAYCHMYIDDAAVGCPLTTIAGSDRPIVDWSVVGPMVQERIEQNSPTLAKDVIDVSSLEWKTIVSQARKNFGRTFDTLLEPLESLATISDCNTIDFHEFLMDLETELGIGLDYKILEDKLADSTLLDIYVCCKDQLSGG